MHCSKCKTENKTEAKFCKKCGQKLHGTQEGPKRCANGHIMKPSWRSCHICDAGRGAVEKPAVQLQETIMEEDPAANLQMHPSSAQNETGGLAGSRSPAVKNVPSQPPQEHQKTMILGGSDAASSPQEKDRRLAGFLVSFSRKTQGEHFALYTTDRYAIGRGKKVDICFAHDSLISESHALLRYTGGRFEYQDNMSTNGSYINGKRIEQRAVLNNYDTITLGNTELLMIMVKPEA